MLILSGKHTGKTGRPHNFANNWITVSGIEGAPNLVVSPLQVKLDPDDFALFASRDPSHPKHQQAAGFWASWQLNPDGTFTSIGQPHTRRGRITHA